MSGGATRIWESVSIAFSRTGQAARTSKHDEIDGEYPGQGLGEVRHIGLHTLQADQDRLGSQRRPQRVTSELPELVPLQRHMTK